MSLTQTMSQDGIAVSFRITAGSTLPNDVDILVRWGSSTPANGSAVHEFNTAEAIRRTSDKVKMLEAFTEHEVSCPKWFHYDSYDEIDTYPIIVRKKNHFKGHGFWVCQNRAELRRFESPEYYAVTPVNINTEFRVFVFGGKIMEINKKAQEGQRIGDGLNPLIRNHHNGWICRRGGFEVPKGIRSVARAAAEAVGLDFGACDVYQTVEGDIGCFEINSAPGLVERKVEKVARKLIECYVSGKEV